MASQQAYPSYGSSSTSQQSYPVPRPTSAAPATTPLLVTVIGGRDFVVDARSVYDVTGTLTVGVL